MAVLTACLFTSAASADLSDYSQDFDSMSIGDGAALTNDGYKVFGNVFDATTGAYKYGYGPFDAPNGGAGFSAVASGEGQNGAADQYINIYSDYNNGDHANSYIDALVFQEQTIGSGNAGPGKSAVLSFDFLKNPTVNNGDGDTTTFAFIKVLDSLGGSFATLGQVEFDTTAASTSLWAKGSISLDIDAAWDGQLLQFGFRSYATNFNDSGRFYDNVQFSAVPEPTSMAFIGLGIVGLVVRRRRK